LKPVAAMGLVMVMVGAMVALGTTTLRPVGGALLICGVVIGVYGSLPRGSRSTRQNGPYSWEKEENSGPREFYTANPSEVRLKLRQQTQEPQFTTPRPGSIPTSRQQVPAAPSPLADMLNSEPFDMPPMAPLPPVPFED